MLSLLVAWILFLTMIPPPLLPSASPYSQHPTNENPAHLEFSPQTPTCPWPVTHSPPTWKSFRHKMLVRSSPYHLWTLHLEPATHNLSTWKGSLRRVQVEHIQNTATYSVTYWMHVWMDLVDIDINFNSSTLFDIDNDIINDNTTMKNITTHKFIPFVYPPV